MKSLLLTCLIFTASLAFAGDKPVAVAAEKTVVAGEVLEVKEVASYTYLRLKTKNGETWAAVSKAAVSKGSKVTVENVTVMNNFESKSLNKTFDTIYFGTLAGAAGHSALATTAPEPADVKVPKATGINAKTVAEIIAQAATLKDKPVVVRGKIVKYNPGIMGKNWIHLRDGSGSAADNNNDILVTTGGEAKLGDVVTLKGTVRTNKDFGAGYSYKVLVEDASLQP
jgi:hypothetical protein